MVKLTFAYSAALILLGLIVWGGTQASWTALIPTFLGVISLVFAVLGLKESLRKHTMHVTSPLAVFVVLASIAQIAQGLSSEDPRYLAMVETAIMGIFTVVYLGFCVRSFVVSRFRQRAAEKV